ncbi:MAG: gamma-glutamyl-gamma-aminobutyrate hydrolase family protein [Anaerolineae bacterium]|nr:gamma-glutamyl-gamma-aminobutyrate hydrolase family protein [Anaerolineae bacterium]
MIRDKCRPVVGVLCSNRIINGGSFNVVLDKYLEALRRLSGCEALLIPATTDIVSIPNILKSVHGILLPGSRTMVHPSTYGEEEAYTQHEFDRQRDKAAFALVQYAVKTKMPLLGICRGMQEIVCALGGGLHQDLERLQRPILNHRVPATTNYEERYYPVHSISINAGGMLNEMNKNIGWKREVKVNSLHNQCVNLLPECLRVEAKSEDGVTEAVSTTESSHWLMGVQWHPEWHENLMPINALLFKSFGCACREYEKRATKPSSTTRIFQNLP